MAKEPQSTLERKTDLELQEIAVGVATNEIFTDKHVAPGDIRLITTIFAPLGFLGRKELLKMQRRCRPGLIYAPMKLAGPRSINGYPIFFEMHLLHPDDATIVWDKYERLSQTLDQV